MTIGIRFVFARDDCSGAAIRHDNVDRQGRQLGRQLWEKRDIAAVRTEVEDDVAALDVTQLAKPLFERLENRRFVVIRGRQNADARHLPCGLLRERLFGHGSQGRNPGGDKVATFNSTTSPGSELSMGEPQEYHQTRRGLVLIFSATVFPLIDRRPPAQLIDDEASRCVLDEGPYGAVRMC
jgi:hypothetical protein